MSKSNLLVWMHSNEVKNGCVLGNLSGIDSIYDLNEGVSFEGRFPSDAKYSLHADFPNNLVLTDNLINSDGLMVVSSRLKVNLENRGLKDVEYHSVEIRDHKGRVFSKDYFILHPVKPVECLNHEASGANASLILPSVIDNVDELVLHEEQVPLDRQLFRIAGFPDATLIRRDLAEDLNNAQFTGFRWLELSDYPEI